MYSLVGPVVIASGVLSRRSKQVLRKPIIEPVMKYVAKPEICNALRNVRTAGLVVMTPPHSSRSFLGKEHITVEAYDAQNRFVKVLHISRDGNDGELIVPDANTLAKRMQNPVEIEDPEA